MIAMNEPKNKKALLDAISEAVSEYSYENDDKDFTFQVKVFCDEDGWSGATENK